MSRIDRPKMLYLLHGMTDAAMGDELSEEFRTFLAVEHTYLSATREIITKLENLNDEFKYGRDHNPIHQISSRIKTPRRIIEKLTQDDHEVSIASAREHLSDIAGVRVICSYIDDIYLVAKLLASQDDIELVREIDYIKNPKRNGYRSLHLIVTVPVFLSSSVERVKVEVQIRTIAMDFWASLEHELAYRLNGQKTQELTDELRACAEVIAETDSRMQELYNAANAAKPRHGGLTLLAHGERQNSEIVEQVRSELRDAALSADKLRDLVE